VAAAAAPGATDPLAVHTEGELPFTVAELESALALRAAIAAPEAASSITATVIGDGATIHVAVLGRDKDVRLDSERGRDAARLVAFVILDLAADQLDPPAGGPRAQPRRMASAALVRSEVPAVPDREYAPRAALAVWGRGGTRTDGELELAVPLAGSVRALISGGAGTRAQYTGTSASVFGAQVSVRGYPLRAGVAWRGPNVWLGELELRAGAVALVESASGMLASTTAIYGGGAAVAWALPILELASNRGATVTLGVGADAFATANDYRIHAMSVTVTPRVAWWGGIAIAAELWR
jgi:hypothetical protein